MDIKILISLSGLLILMLAYLILGLRLFKYLLWFLRFILVIPISLLVFWGIEIGLVYLFLWLFGLSKVGFMLFVFLIGGTSFWTLLFLISNLCFLASKISPIKFFGEIVVGVNAIYLCIMLIRDIWVMHSELDLTIMVSSILTGFVLLIFLSMLMGIFMSFEKSQSQEN